MNKEEIENLSDLFDEDRRRKYYSKIKEPLSFLIATDFYRLEIVKKFLVGNSVLDIGCYRGDFLKMIADKYEIAGLDINEDRVNIVNNYFKKKIAYVGNLEIDDHLIFTDKSYDTVTCMEVIEHLPNLQKIVTELLRITKKRLIISVPYKEKINYTVCLHCGNKTPSSGHIHVFDQKSLDPFLDSKSEVRCILLNNSIFSFFRLYKLPIFVSYFIDHILNLLFPDKAVWIVYIIDLK
jgi:ubiquinone/menaquinone biosynthesis C-methylase UbiE